MSYIEQAYGKHYLPSCTVCGQHIYKGDLPTCGVAKKASGGHVFWHDRCYQERFGKTPDEYGEMKGAEVQTELDPEQQRVLDGLRKGRGMRTESVHALVFENGKCWMERRDGYRKAEGLYVCKRKHGKPSERWESIDADSGLRVTGPFRTKGECDASLDGEKLDKLAKHRGSHRYRGAVRAAKLVGERGSMPTDEYNRMRERYAAEELDKFKQQMKEENMEEGGWKEAPKSAEPVIGEVVEGLKGERVCITGTLAGMSRQEAFIRLKQVGGVPCEKFSGKVTLFVIAANGGKEKRAKAEKAVEKGQKVRIVDGSAFLAALKKAEQEATGKSAEQQAEKKHAENEEEKQMKERIAELEKELKATRKELEDVWKENATLKAKQAKADKPKAPEPPKPAKKEPQAESVSLDLIGAWCGKRGLVASQKADGCCIWVEGESKPYAEELKEMGFRFAKKRKSWYLDPKRAA